MGMNTSDFQTMPQGQWLFWAVLIPLMIVVLVICLFIVQYKFKLQRSFQTIFLTFFSTSRVAESYGDSARQRQ
jgi:hypothetical protein